MTYLDSGVLLGAWRRGRNHDIALAIIADEDRQFLTSDAVKLELLPKPTFEKRHAELDFYNDHFNAAVASEPFSAELGDAALSLAKKHGLAAIDAIHLAAAIRQGAEEFITSELPEKPMFRVTGIKIISLHQLAFRT